MILTMKRTKTDVRHQESFHVDSDVMDRLINKTTWVSFRRARLDTRC